MFLGRGSPVSGGKITFLRCKAGDQMSRIGGKKEDICDAPGNA